MPRSFALTGAQFYITHLYPDELSIYGDMGNIIALSRIIKLLGMEPVYQKAGVGQALPKQSDIYFIGGGQDAEQERVGADLVSKAKRIHSDIEKGVPLLAICGGYQLLGVSYVTGTGAQVDGTGLFKVRTTAPDEKVTSRCIGNIITSCTIPGLENELLIGFENHGGQTKFVENIDYPNAEFSLLSHTSCYPLGIVQTGFGNTSDGDYEGCVYKHAVGTYLHGSCLPKNPRLACWLIDRALECKAGENSSQKDQDSDTATHSSTAHNLSFNSYLTCGLEAFEITNATRKELLARFEQKR